MFRVFRVLSCLPAVQRLRDAVFQHPHWHRVGYHLATQLPSGYPCSLLVTVHDTPARNLNKNSVACQGNANQSYFEIPYYPGQND